MVPFGSLLYYGTYHVGCPQRDLNVDNYPFLFQEGVFNVSKTKGWVAPRTREASPDPHHLSGFAMASSATAEMPHRWSMVANARPKGYK